MPCCCFRRVEIRDNKKKNGLYEASCSLVEPKKIIKWKMTQSRCWKSLTQGILFYRKIGAEFIKGKIFWFLSIRCCIFSSFGNWIVSKAIWTLFWYVSPLVAPCLKLYGARYFGWCPLLPSLCNGDYDRIHNGAKTFLKPHLFVLIMKVEEIIYLTKQKYILTLLNTLCFQFFI